LSATKTAQYNLVTSMHEAFGPQGVHVATVLVGGVVSEQAQNLNPTNVANVMWMLYEQDKGSWVKEVDIFQ
jgi:short-subunit dehydrogenase